MPRPPPGTSEIVAFERRLDRDARRRADDAGDAELGEILRHVASRRAGRATRGASERSGAPDAVWAVDDVAPDVRILRTGRPVGLDFRSGQHVKLGVAGHRRATFSIASAPHEPHLEFCLELIAGGRVTPMLFALAPGDRVEIADRAKGSFALDLSATRHLMVATVTGIAPLRSMLVDALHRGITGEFIVLHGASHADELPYLDELTALAEASTSVTYRPTVSRPSDARNAAWRRDTGRVDDLASRVAADMRSAETRVYACGNAAMVDRVRSQLGADGFAVSSETYD